MNKNIMSKELKRFTELVKNGYLMTHYLDENQDSVYQAYALGGDVIKSHDAIETINQAYKHLQQRKINMSGLTVGQVHETEKCLDCNVLLVFSGWWEDMPTSDFAMEIWQCPNCHQDLCLNCGEPMENEWGFGRGDFGLDYEDGEE